MNKRVLLYLTAFVCIGLLTGCKNKESGNNQTTDDSSQNQSSEYSSDDFWNIGSEPTQYDTDEDESENDMPLVEFIDTEDDLSDDSLEMIDGKIITACEGADRDDNSTKRVVCWGDSLTEGTGGDGVTMPNTIADLSGAEVLNYGVFAETSTCIAARQGSNPQYTVEDLIIPADCTPVKAQVSGSYGYEMLLDFGNAGINNVVLNGIEGTYAYDENYNRCFTRLTPGEPVAVPAGTQFITHAMLDKRDDDIAVFWVGSNDKFESDDDIIGLLERIDKMIEYHGNDKYVIVSLTARHAFIDRVLDVNASLRERYNDHYIDIRTFLVNDSLNYLNITPTDKDNEALARDDIPYSIRATMDEDENHGNPDFYRIIGELVYRKLRELEYLK